jgi:aminodeoxyfutalosine deaminase
MLILADTVLAGAGEEISPGAVRVEGAKIQAVGAVRDLARSEGEEVIELRGQILSPGFVNAHCHLDYTEMSGLPATRGFTKWIEAINACKRGFGPEDYLGAIAKGFSMLQASGTTTVANIEAFPELFPLLPRPPIRTWWFWELIDVRNRQHDDASLHGMLQFFEQRPSWLGGFGLSPHAPYTASIELYRLAKRCSELYDMPFTTHIAESREEHEMFLYGRGALYDLMASLGRDMSDCGQGSPLSHLLEYRVLTPKCLAVHVNYLQAYDWPLLVESQASVVHCPKCHEFFHHAQFPLEQMRSLGINVCLGTDSMASNNSLDLRSEIRQAQIYHRDILPVDWWRMITIDAAKALGQAGKIGEIRAGASADIVAFPSTNSDPYISLIAGRHAPTFTMIAGEQITLAA